MSELPVQGLLQQLGARRVSGEDLEVLGKHASELWHAGRAETLSEAVVESVKHAGLSPEQVRRVIEFTNTHAYLTEFKKEGAHKVIDFGPGGPADASDILKDLNDGGGGSLYDRGTLDYDHPPHETKLSSVRAESALSSLFGGAPELPYADPLQEAMELRDKLASASDHLLAEIGGLEIMYADLGARLYGQVKQAALEGVSLSDICQAFETVSPDGETVKLAFQLFSPRLLREGVFSSGREMISSIEKTASVGVVNPEHPLVQDFAEFDETLYKLAGLRAAETDVAESLAQMTAFLKQAVSGVIGKTLHYAREASKPVAGAAEKLVGGLAGKGAGNVAKHVVGKGVQYLPHAAALVGANEVRRHLMYGPVASQVTNRVLSAVPMTPQYQQRNYNIASGQ